MSKIQKALKRLQSENASGTGKKRTTASGAPAVASIVLDSSPVSDLDATVTHGIVVEIDMNALREAGLIAPGDNDKFLEDQYRDIKRPLIANAYGRRVTHVENGRVIMVTSALPGEGKTFTSLNLAISMSMEQDLSVLLVDADVAKPHISDVLGISDMPGLLDLVEDGESNPDMYTFSTSIPGLSVLPAGKPRANATELLSGARMEELVARMARKDSRRLIVFDTPPLLETSESKVLAGLGGQVVFVVRADSTSHGAVAESMHILGEDMVVNLVLNQSSWAGKDSKYRYGYGYGFDDQK